MRTLIRDLADVRSGYQPRDGLDLTPQGTTLVVQTKDIDDDNNHALLVAQLERASINRDPAPYIIDNGDILFMARGRRRSATLVEGLPGTLPTIALNYFFIIHVRDSFVDPAFLAWAINEPESQEYLEKVSRGTGMPFVTKQSLLQLELIIPPLEKQVSIGRLTRLARRERTLCRQLEQQRAKLLHSACRMLLETSNE